MQNQGNQHLLMSVLGAISLVLVALSLACATAEPSSTPVPPATPAQPVAPVATLATQSTSVPISPTPVSATPTPTRIVPTATATLATGKPVYGGTLRYAHEMSIDTLDPVFNATAGGYSVFFLIYDGLFRTEPDGRISPSLAQSWEFSADAKTITVNLQKGVKFHDGTDFNANAMKWNFDRMLDPGQVSPRRGELSPYLDQLEVVNESTIKLRLSVAFRPLLAQAGSDRMGYMVSPSAVTKFGGGRDGAYGRNPVGTGPFQFVSWTPQERLLVTRNNKYWDQGKPYLDAVLMLSVPETSSRVAMIRTGEADLMYTVGFDSSNAPALERNPNTKVLRRDGGSTHILQINPNIRPFDNMALRQAMAYAIDREGFVKVVLNGIGAPANSMINSGWAANPDIKPFAFDITKAKEKLAQAGYTAQVTIPIACRSTEIYVRVCETLQASMNRAGIDLKLSIRDPSTYSDRRSKSGFFLDPGAGTIVTSERIDPHTNLYDFSGSNGRNNPNGYKNPEVDRLLDEASAIFDIAKAKPLYDRIQSIVSEDAALIFLASYPGLYPANKRVQGYVPYFLSDRFEFVWLER